MSWVTKPRECKVSAYLPPTIQQRAQDPSPALDSLSFCEDTMSTTTSLNFGLNAEQVKLIKATLTVAAIAAIPWAADFSANAVVANVNVPAVSVSH